MYLAWCSVVLPIGAFLVRSFLFDPNCSWVLLAWTLSRLKPKPIEADLAQKLRSLFSYKIISIRCGDSWPSYAWRPGRPARLALVQQWCTSRLFPKGLLQRLKRRRGAGQKKFVNTQYMPIIPSKTSICVTSQSNNHSDATFLDVLVFQYIRLV